MNLRLHDKCNPSINRLIFLALFSILLYHLLTHVRMAKIVINFTPIVKDFLPKLRKKTNFSEKTDKYTTRKSKVLSDGTFFKRSYRPVCTHYFRC